MENATKQARLVCSAASFDPVTKDLLVTNATKREYRSQAPRTRVDRRIPTG